MRNCAPCAPILFYTSQAPAVFVHMGKLVRGHQLRIHKRRRPPGMNLSALTARFFHRHHDHRKGSKAALAVTVAAVELTAAPTIAVGKNEAVNPRPSSY